MPGIIALLAAAHVGLSWLHGAAGPGWEPPSGLAAKAEPFWPRQAGKNALSTLAVLGGLSVWCVFQPVALGVQADPSAFSSVHPNWYLLPWFVLAQCFHGSYEAVGTFALPGLVFLVLLCWPLIDRSPQRDPRRRPVAIHAFGLLIVAIVGLTVYAAATGAAIHESAAAAAPRTARTAPTPPAEASPEAPAKATPTPAAKAATASRPASVLSATSGSAAGPQKASSPTPARKTQQPLLPAGAEAEAERVFRANCARCHDPDGKGNAMRAVMPKIPDFTDQKWQAAHTSAELEQAVLNGKGTFMPAWKGKLGGFPVGQLVEYVREFAGGEKAVGAKVPSLSPLPATPPSLPLPSTSSSPSSTSPSQPAEPAATPATEPAAAPSAKHIAAHAPAGKESPRPTASSQPYAISPAARVGEGLFQHNCVMCHGPHGRGTPMRAAMPVIPNFTEDAFQNMHSDGQLIAAILNGKGGLMPSFAGKLTTAEVQDLVAYVRTFGPHRAKPAPPGADAFGREFAELQQRFDRLEKEIQALDVGKAKP